MSRYFSRLAQRSGVSDAPAPPARPAAGAGVDAWSETAAETVALGAPSSAGNWLPEAGDFAPPAPLHSVPGATASSVVSGKAPAAAVRSDANPVERTLATPDPGGAHFLAHVRAVGEQWRSHVAPDAPHPLPQTPPVVAMPPIARAVAVATGRTSETAEATAPAVDAGIASASTGPVARRVKAGSRTAAVPASAPTRSRTSTVDARPVSTMPRPIDALPPPRDGVAGERVSAQSPSPPAAGVQRAAPAAAPPPLQVHIGRIELEVHAPIAAMPAPALAAAAPPPAPARDAGFSPHRHYLRGR